MSCLRDVSSWSNWVDETYAAHPLERGRARSAQHRIALARRHGLRRLDSQRATALELAGLLHEVGRFVDSKASSAHHEPADEFGTHAAHFLSAAGLHDVTALVAAVFARTTPSDSDIARGDRDGGTVIRFDPTRGDVDHESVAMLRYIEMTSDDDGCAIALPEKRSLLVARFGAVSDAVARFDQRLGEALEGQRLLTFGRARHATAS